MLVRNLVFSPKNMRTIPAIRAIELTNMTVRFCLSSSMMSVLFSPMFWSSFSLFRGFEERHSKDSTRVVFAGLQFSASMQVRVLLPFVQELQAVQDQSEVHVVDESPPLPPPPPPPPLTGGFSGVHASQSAGQDEQVSVGLQVPSPQAMT